MVKAAKAITPGPRVAPAKGAGHDRVGGLSEDDFKRFVQDLSEFHLLLDFISGRPDKRLSIVELAGDAGRVVAAEVVKRVTNVRYPQN